MEEIVKKYCDVDSENSCFFTTKDNLLFVLYLNYNNVTWYPNPQMEVVFTDSEKLEMFFKSML